jgi:hypothetical protein
MTASASDHPKGALLLVIVAGLLGIGIFRTIPPPTSGNLSPASVSREHSAPATPAAQPLFPGQSPS